MFRYHPICIIFLIVTFLSFLGGDLTLAADTSTTNSLSAGFLFDHFKLTLTEGERTEAAGPFFYSQKTADEQTLAFPPFFSKYEDPGVDTEEYDILYPLLTDEHYSDEWRWQFAQTTEFCRRARAGGSLDQTIHFVSVLFPAKVGRDQSELYGGRAILRPSSEPFVSG